MQLAKKIIYEKFVELYIYKRINENKKNSCLKKRNF